MNTNSALTRRTSLRRAFASVSVCATFALVAACQQTDPGTGEPADGDDAASTFDRIKEEGVIRVGFAGERPYAYEEDGELVGQAPAVQGYIFGEIDGIKLEAQQFEFGALIPALNSGRVDVITAGMYITPERCLEVAFGNPDFVDKVALMTESGNPLGLADLQSIADDEEAVVAVLTGAVQADQAERIGIPKDRTQIVADQQAGLAAVESGRADAFVVSSVSARELVEGHEQVEVGEPFVVAVEGVDEVAAGAAAFRQEDVDLREAYDEELAKLLESDTWLELVEPYGYTEDERPDPSVTTEKLCQGE